MVTTTPTAIALLVLRLVLFGLSLGLTVISYRAYSSNGGDRLKFAFIGFAFVSMGVAVSNLNTQLLLATTGGADREFVLLQIAGTIPFSVGFGAIYLSLYR